MFVNPTGNPALGQGGSGDLLAGYLAGLLAQPLLREDFGRTIRYAAWQHGAAADELATARRAMEPHELTDALVRATRKLAPADRLVWLFDNVDAAERLDRFGTAIGLMFQIVDDVLDETQSTEHLGKTGGKDRASGKRTFPSILGLDASRTEIRSLADEASSSLDGPWSPPSVPISGPQWAEGAAVGRSARIIGVHVEILKATCNTATTCTSGDNDNNNKDPHIYRASTLANSI